MAKNTKLPKLQREAKLSLKSFIPNELTQLSVFTPKGFKKQIKSTMSREADIGAASLIPKEIQSLKRLKPKALARAALGPSIKQRAAIGVTSVIAQEAPILLALLKPRKKQKKADTTIPLLIRAKTETLLIRKISEGSLTSKKQITEIVKQQQQIYKQEIETKQKTVEKVSQKPLYAAVTGMSVAATILLYGPAMWPFVKDLVGQLASDLISEGIKALPKPIQTFIELFSSGKASETFNSLLESIDNVSSEISSVISDLNPLKQSASQLEEKLTVPSQLPANAKNSEDQFKQIKQTADQIKDLDLESETGPEQIQQQKPKPIEEKEGTSPTPKQARAVEKPVPPKKEELPQPVSKVEEKPLPAPAPQPTVVTTAPKPERSPTLATVVPSQAKIPEAAPQAPERKETPQSLNGVVQLQTGVELTGLNQTLEQQTAAMAAAFKEKTGKTLLVTSGVRSNEKQKLLWDAEVERVGSPELARKKVAEPAPPLGRGKGSLHLKGLALDINSKGTNGLNILAGTQSNPTGWLESFGLTRPVSREDWHIQLVKTPPTPDNPTEPGVPLIAPDSQGGGVNVATGREINGMSVEANRHRKQPREQKNVVIVKTTQVHGLST